MTHRANGIRRRVSRGFETLESRRLLAGDMTNPNNSLDVNNDSQVTATDALAIINYLAQQQAAGEQTAAYTRSGKQIFPDTSGDGKVAASDALRVINAMAEGQQVSPPAPNLVVTGASVVGNLGTVQISNTGAVATTVGTTVRVEVLNTPIGTINLGEFPVGTVGAGSSTSVSASLSGLLNSAIPSGNYNVRFTVDPSDLIDETDESNANTINLSLQGQDPEYSMDFDTGSSPKVHIDATDTLIRVSTPSSGKLRFQIGNDLDRTISIKHHLWMDVDGENNKVLFEGARIPHNLYVDFGGSDNAIVLSDSRVGGVFLFNGSKHDDTVVINDGTKIESSVIIKTQSGDDMVLVQDASIWRDFIYHAGDDDDMFAALDSSFGSSLVALMQDGKDQVSLEDINVKYAAVINGGRNKDSLATSDVNARNFIDHDFESKGNLKDVQALIDEVCAGFVQTDNGDTGQTES